jgi:twinkle protein
MAFFGGRKIGRPVVERYRIVLAVEWMPQLEERVECIQFPYYRGDECINIKSRSLEGKHFRQIPDAEKILYGLNDLTEEWAILCEGEMDKLSFAEAGILPCASVPDGAPAPNAKPSAKKFEYLENCEQALGRLSKIILATDNDAPGRALEQELARRLGPERCWRVHWPDGVKDANELLMRDGAAGLHALIDQATPWPIDGILHASDLAHDTVQYYYDGRTRGLSTGWSHLDEFYTVRAGELTVVTGIPSHGKSEFLDALMVNMCQEHGWVFACCSPENRPLKYHLAKLVEKVSGLPFLPGRLERISPYALTDALQWIDDHVVFIDPDAAMTVPALLEKAKALVLREGVTGLLIDPWNEFDHTRGANLTETEYISQCLSQFKNFSRTHGVHVWIVAHPAKLHRKDDGSYPVPTPYDISGSAHWRNKPDNCLAVWRDVVSDDNYAEVHVQKVRFKEVGRVGVAGFTWDPANGRYTPTEIRSMT